MTDDRIPSNSGGEAKLDVRNLQPINCSRVISLLGEYSDGEISSEEHARIEAHLSSCPACASDMAGYLEVIRLAGWLPGINPPAAIERRLRSLISNAIQRNQFLDNSMDETIKDRPGI